MSSMPQHSIYVRREDQELWEWAQTYAKAHRMTTSAVILTAIEQFREQVEGRADDGDGPPPATA